MNAQPQTPLSPRGAARRDAMLADLQGAVRARGRRRRAAQAGAAVAALALLATGVAAISTLHRPAAPAEAPPIARTTDPAPPPSPAPTRPLRIAYVANDADILARVSVRPEHSRVRRLDDDSLLEALESAGLPAGLARSGGEVRLAFHQAPPAPPTN